MRVTDNGFESGFDETDRINHVRDTKKEANKPKPQQPIRMMATAPPAAAINANLCGELGSMSVLKWLGNQDSNLSYWLCFAPEDTSPTERFF